MTRTIALMGLSSLLMSCATDIEGDEAFECSDGADNDGNGYFDCQDNGCWNSPDCAGGDNNNNNNNNNNDPTAIARHLTDVSVTYTLEWLFDDFYEQAFCTEEYEYLACDCKSTYVGSGTQVVAEGNRVTMEGAYTLESSDCNDTFTSAETIWYAEPGAKAHHTFFFEPDMSLILDWVTHAQLTRFEPEPSSPASYSQFYITSMLETWDDSNKEVVHVFQETVDLGGLPTNLVHTLTLRFNGSATN